MSAASYFFVMIDPGTSRAVVMFDGTSGGKVTRKLDSPEDWDQFLISKANEYHRETGKDPAEDFIIACSSGLDWPWDYDGMTGEVVRICNHIRGNSIPLTREEDENG